MAQQGLNKGHDHRQRSVIDLTSPDEEAKRRIVAHAQQQQHLRQLQEHQQQQQPVTIELSDDGSDEENQDSAAGGTYKRQRGDEHVAAQHGAQQHQQDTGMRDGQAPFPNPMLYPMRDVLKAAHQERLRRQQQQQPPEQQPPQPQQDPEVEMGTPTAPRRPSTVLGAGGAASKVPSAAAVGTKRPRLFGDEGLPGGGGGGGAGPRTGPQPAAPAQPARGHGPATISVLTFNIWFAEPVALEERMQGLADLVLSLEPDVILLQEVTNNMVRLWFEQHAWLADVYTFSQPPTNSPYYTMLAFRKHSMRPLAANAAMVALQGVPNMQPRLITRWPFPNSQMGRDVVSVALQPSQHPNAPPLLVATSHLESPLGTAADKHMAREREQQVALALPHLAQAAATVASLAQPNRLQQQQQQQRQRQVDVLWGGDFNWNQANKREPELPDGWEDVWPNHPEARAPGEQPDGFTYDRRRNATIAGSRFPPARLDRFLARLDSWQVESMRLVGTEPLEGVTAQHYGKVVKVHVSDHFGILLRLRWDGN